MNFFTKKSIEEPANGSPLSGWHQASTLFSQKKSLIISILCALLLLISSLVKAEGNTVPGMPGLISGQKNVCAYVGSGQAINYSIGAVPGAQLYLWTVPSTVQIVSGQGTIGIS